jgi:hypothetical protein
MCRHLATVDPAAAAAAAARDTAPEDGAWLRALPALGFDDVATYLTNRHLACRYTTSAIAREVGVTSSAVLTAMRRHRIERTRHATSRGRVVDRAAAVAARFDFPDLDHYLADRRAAGLSWRAIATECGQPPSWVRRRAGLR